MKADILIPTYKPDDTFCLLLHRLREQTFVVNRVIIINTDESLWDEAIRRHRIREALDALPCNYSVLHIAKEEFDHGGTRALGAAMSDADIFICMTQDAVPADKHLTENLVNALAGHDGAAVAYARQLPAKDCGVIERYTRNFNYPEESLYKTAADRERLGIKTYFCSDVCAAYRSDIYETLGGFEKPCIFNEDMFYAAKAINAGYGVVYAAKAAVIHSHNYTASQQFHRNFDLAVSQQIHPEIFEDVSSESEGIRLVMGTVRYLIRRGKPHLIIRLFVQSAAKYAGYFLGSRYEKLSRKQIMRCTMNRDYWRHIWKVG
jgi:rhamnosyltransferase